MEPLISVIVPVYRVEAYLDRCMASLLAQTYENLEIILVDDGSPDGCPGLCDSYAQKDRRVRVIHQDNRGLSGARNTGIEAAGGDYLEIGELDMRRESILFLWIRMIMCPGTLSVPYMNCWKKRDAPSASAALLM